MNCSPQGSFVHEISQARIPEWVAISFSRGSSWPRIEPVYPALQTDSLTTKPQGSQLCTLHAPKYTLVCRHMNSEHKEIGLERTGGFHGQGGWWVGSSEGTFELSCACMLHYNLNLLYPKCIHLLYNKRKKSWGPVTRYYYQHTLSSPSSFHVLGSKQKLVIINYQRPKTFFPEGKTSKPTKVI